MCIDPGVEELSDIALTTVAAGSCSRCGDDGRNIVEYRKCFNDGTDIIAVVFGSEGDVNSAAERSDDSRIGCIIRQCHDAASIIDSHKCSALGIEPGGVLRHSSRTWSHAILQIIGDDRRCIVWRYGYVLNKGGCVAEVIISNPFADDRAACTKYGGVRFGKGDG